ncbi:MAG TPA: DNA alkylation repair protein [Anaeromyxobacter sp.]|nr:DNA alkylation repair protein [Anaeromyxobacter sp.]
MRPHHREARLIADALLAALRPQGASQRARMEKRYLKSDLEHLGLTVPAVRRTTREFARAHPLDGAGRAALVRELWARGIYELRAAAVELLVSSHRSLEPADLPLLEELLRDAHTWALVDELSARCLGSLADRFAAVRRVLPRLGRDPDFWVRRAALLAHLLSLREGRGELAAFGRLAEPLLGDREFFIRKAIGWVLREAGRRDPESVATWLLPRAERAAHLTVREAVRYLPPARARAVLRAAGIAGQRLVSPAGAPRTSRGGGADPPRDHRRPSARLRAHGAPGPRSGDRRAGQQAQGQGPALPGRGLPHRGGGAGRQLRPG